MDIDKMINVSMDMMDAVTDAVNRGDFSDLNETLQRMIRPSAYQGSWEEYTEAERRREQEMRQRQAAMRAQQARRAEEARRQAQAQQQARYEQYRQQQAQQQAQQAPAMGRQFGGAYPYRTPYFQQDVGRYNGLPRVIIGAALVAFSAFGAMFGLGVGLLDHSVLEGIISSVPSQSTRCATSGRSACSARMASVVWRLARSSSHLPSRTSATTTATLIKMPMLSRSTSR